MASHEAARRAVAAGYKDVAVMGDGIVGWFALRQPIQHIGGSEAPGKSS
jgi:hypothetical protein